MKNFGKPTHPKKISSKIQRINPSFMIEVAFNVKGWLPFNNLFTIGWFFANLFWIKKFVQGWPNLYKIWRSWAFSIWNNGKTPTCEQKPTSHSVKWCFEHKNFKQIVQSCLKVWYFVNESLWILGTKYELWIIQFFLWERYVKWKKVLKSQSCELAYFTHEQCYPFHEYFSLKDLIFNIWPMNKYLL